MNQEQKVKVYSPDSDYKQGLASIAKQMVKNVIESANLSGNYLSETLKQEGNKRKAILLKHRNMRNKELNFEIKEKGIFKRGWI